MKSRTLVVLLDADGCFYNKKVQCRFLYALCKYSEFIDNMSVDSKHESGFTDVLADSEARLLEIRKDVRQVKLKDAVFPALIEEARSKFRPGIELKNDVDVDIFLRELITKYIMIIAELDRRFLDDILYRSNRRLIQKIKARVDAEEIQKIVFMVGSNRQSFSIDIYNMRTKGTSSFFQDLPIFVDRLNLSFSRKRNVEVVLDKFVMADIYSDFLAGESYKRILGELNSYDLLANHGNTIFDSTKLTIIYAFLHYVANTYKREYESGELFVEYYDDTPYILEALRDAFIQKGNHDLLPEKLQFHMYNYIGKRLREEQKIVVPCSGVVDPFYRANIKKMIALCPKENANAKIDVARQLDFAKFNASKKCVEQKSPMKVSSSDFSLFPSVEKSIANPDTPCVVPVLGIV